MRSITLTLTLLVLGAPLWSCAQEEAAPETPPAAPAGTPTPAASPPPDFAPVTSRDDADPAPAGSEHEILAPGARFVLPADWVPEPPSSSMRLAQARIPGPGGDAQLTVFYFGPGGGGGVEENLARWVGQMDVEPGTEPRRDAFAAGPFRVTWVDVEGTLKPSMMGTGPDTPQPGSRLLAAVVEGPQGPWFFKATGPAETLDAARDDFLAMLRGAAPHA